MKLMYHILYFIYCFFLFRCREKGFEEEEGNKNKDANSRGATTSQLRKRDQDDGILGFDLVFVGQNNTYFNVIFYYTVCFQKVNSQEFTLCTYLNFKLSSAFLYALCELLEKQAALCGHNRSSRWGVFC